MPKLEQACKRLKKSYNGALEMAGEKGEEVEVLQGEMQQVKEVFRGQVTSLMEQIEQLENNQLPQPVAESPAAAPVAAP